VKVEHGRQHFPVHKKTLFTGVLACTADLTGAKFRVLPLGRSCELIKRPLQIRGTADRFACLVDCYATPLILR
jgi:hypothetical protein